MKKLTITLIGIIGMLGAQTIPFNQIQHATNNGSLVISSGTAHVLTYTSTLPASAIPTTAIYQPSLNGTGFVVATGSVISYDNTTYVPVTRSVSVNNNSLALNSNIGFTTNTIPTGVKTANYSASIWDFVPCDVVTVGSFTVTLPTAPIDGAEIGAKIVSTSGTNIIVVKCGGSDVFNRTGGAAQGTITLPGQAMNFQYKASTGIWYVVSGDIPLNQLDARFTTTAAVAGSYVPYSGATTSLNLNSQSFTTTGSVGLGTTTITSANQAFTITDGTINAGVYLLNSATSSSVYNGPWIGSYSKRPVHFVSGITAGGLPAISITSLTSGAVNGVLINGPTTYTTTSQLDVYDGGGVDVFRTATAANNETHRIEKTTGNTYIKGLAVIGSTLANTSYSLNVIGTGSVSAGVTTPSVFGSAAASETLYLQSTSNATKGFVSIGASTGTTIVNSVLGSGSLTTIGSTVLTAGQPSLLVIGNASVSTNFTASGTFSAGSTGTINGAFKANSTATVAGALEASTTLSVGTTATVTGALLASSNATITGNQLFTGTTQANGTVNIGPGTYGTDNLHQLRISKGTGTTDIGEYTAGRAAIWLGQNTPASGNYALSHSGTGTTFLNASTGVDILINGGIQIAYTTLLGTFGSGLGSYDFAFPSTAGTKLGTTTSDKIGFWNKTPIIQPVNTTALDVVLVNTGLMASGATTAGISIPLNVTGSVSCTSFSASSNATISGQAILKAGVVLSYTNSSAAALTMLNTITHYSFGGTTSTWTLPAVTGNEGNVMFIKNRGSGLLTINSNAGGNDIFSTSATNTYLLAANSAIMLFNDGTYYNVE